MTELGRGRCLVRLGSGAEAERALRDAREFTNLGAAPELAETDAWLAEANAVGS
jgi:hypothetical protein